MNIEFRPLDKSEEEIFVRENQAAFDKAAIEEFGPQEESVIHRETIVECIHGKFAEFYNPRHPEPHGPCGTPDGEYFFRFEKVMK